MRIPCHVSCKIPKLPTGKVAGCCLQSEHEWWDWRGGSGSSEGAHTHTYTTNHRPTQADKQGDGVRIVISTKKNTSKESKKPLRHSKRKKNVRRFGWTLDSGATKQTPGIINNFHTRGYGGWEWTPAKPAAETRQNVIWIITFQMNISSLILLSEWGPFNKLKAF